MKKHIRKCNAYSGTAYLYSAISVENRTVIAAESALEREVSDDMKGGIIVFPEKADPELSDVEKIIRKHDAAGWTIGRFFKGRKPDKNGEAYSEDSLSVEITGVSDDALEQIGEEFSRVFNLKSVLIKFYAERNRIVVLNR